MSKFEDKICPFLHKECLSSGCALYEEKLDNCVISLLAYNLFKLFSVLNDKDKSKRFPF